MKSIRNSQFVIRNLSVLSYVLDNSLRLLHPFIPFITEEIWQKLKKIQNDEVVASRRRSNLEIATSFVPDELLAMTSESIMTAEWPKHNQKLIDKNSLVEMETLINVIVAVRDLRARFHIKPSQEITIILIVKRKEKKIIEENILYLKSLCRLKELKIEKSSPREKLQAKTLVKGTEIILPLKEVIDLEIEKKRLDAEIEKTEKEITFVETKLKNKVFLKNAPKIVVSKEQEKEKNLSEKLKKLRETLDFMH